MNFKYLFLVDFKNQEILKVNSIALIVLIYTTYTFSVYFAST